MSNRAFMSPSTCADLLEEPLETGECMGRIDFCNYRAVFRTGNSLGAVTADSFLNVERTEEESQREQVA